MTAAGFCPMGDLCRQTVTVYRKRGREILRQVAEGCYLEGQDARVDSQLGSRAAHRFLLVMPGATQRVFPGDRIFDGVGPEVTAEEWPEFVPARVPGLYEAAYAAPYTWNGRVCHVEAGRK